MTAQPVRRAWRVAFGCAGAAALVLPLAPVASGAPAAPVTTTDPNIFSGGFSAQAVVPTTNATLQVDDSMAWVHGFFNKSQPELAINAAEYSEIYDPGFLAGAVLFSASTDPTPLSDPNNFPGYAWASFPVPANQTNISKCVTPTAMVAAPCTANSPDQAVSAIDPAAPSGSSYVTATGPGPGDTGGVFTASSTQAVKDGALAVTSDAAGQHVSFAGGQLVISGFRSAATASAKADGTVHGSASCTMGNVDVAGTTVTAGPGGQLDSSQLDPLLAQLNQATGKKFQILSPTKPSVVPGNHSIESSCHGPTVIIANPLPGPLGTLNVVQSFTFGTVDVTSGASGSPGAAASTASGSAGVSSGSSIASGDATVAGAAIAAPPSLGLTPSVGAPSSESTPASASQQGGGGANGQEALATPALRTVAAHVNEWLIFFLAFASGLVLCATAVAMRRVTGVLAAAWRDRVAPIG
jgi:hypothetical protein